MPGISCNTRNPATQLREFPTKRTSAVYPYVGGIEELEPTEFNKRNVPACQLDFERPAVMRGAEQYRLLLQQGAALAIVQHALGDVAGLVGTVSRTLTSCGRSATCDRSRDFS